MKGAARVEGTKASDIYNVTSRCDLREIRLTRLIPRTKLYVVGPAAPALPALFCEAGRVAPAVSKLPIFGFLLDLLRRR